MLTFVIGFKNPQSNPGSVVLSTVLFFIMALVVGFIVFKVFKKLDERYPHTQRIPILGLALCYAFGTAWYLVLYAQAGNPMGLMTALGYCVFPFVIPDLLKLALAALLARRIEKYVQ